MPQERFFLNAPLKLHETAYLTDSELHHLVNVTRCREGDSVEIVNGNGLLAEATVDRIEKKQAALTIVKLSTEPPPKRKIILAQAYPRANRLDTILEKTTELGVTDIWLFPGEKSERKEASPARIESLLTSAMKQSGRLYLPKVTQAPPIKQWPSLPCKTYFGEFAEGAPHLLEASAVKEDTMVVIGPESGLTEAEIAALKDLGCIGVSLGKNILRVDTAAIVAVAYVVVDGVLE